VWLLRRGDHAADRAAQALAADDLHVVRKFDPNHPALGDFPNRPRDLGETEWRSILRRHDAGADIRRLARQRCTALSRTFNRVLLAGQTRSLKRRKIRFIDDPLYHQPTRAEVIDAIVAAGEIGLAHGRELRPARFAAVLQVLFARRLLNLRGSGRCSEVQLSQVQFRLRPRRSIPS